MRLITYIFLLLIFIVGCNKKNSETIYENLQYDEYLWHLFYTVSDFSILYGISEDANINIKNAWQISRGSGVKIAIIDESFDSAHEDISDHVILKYNAIDESENIDYNDSSHSHGNSCAGFASAIDNEVGIIGTAPESSLILIKYGDDDASIIRAFDKAMSVGAKVISCSWGSYSVSESISAKLREVYEAGITVLFAVGNDEKSLDLNYINDESESPYVIAVGASCEDNEVCLYSNYGSALDVIAPGGEHYDSIGVLGLDNMGDDGESNQKELVSNNYSFGSGTSYATPMVAGVVALMYDIKSDITPLQVKQVLIDSAQKIGDGVVYDDNGFNIKRGYGKVDAYKAILLVLEL